MGNVFNPEFAGEKLRALIEIVLPSRQRVVGEAVLYMEKAVSDFELKYSPATSNPTTSTTEKVRFTTKAPEQTMTPKPSVKSNQADRQRSARTQESSLNVSTARANLNAIFSSIEGGQE